MSFRGDTLKRMLPKTYLRKHVSHDIHVALTYFQNLVPVMDKFVYNDGTTKNLMSLTGTVPVMISDKTYNIPICLWIEETYPQTAPICYVKPTSEMMVIRGNYISSNGEILLPYLQHWNKDQCDIVSLLQVMVAMFGEAPPVCMRPHSDPEQRSCGLQYYRQAEVFQDLDGSSYLPLAREDNEPFQQENESNC
uniref:Zgc:123278 n=1 Tax=Amphiprion percula TaxID=161767 RepID=A0A3P8SN78_AMPPE